jgi:KRAB domain-containing zinc finger protein
LQSNKEEDKIFKCPDCSKTTTNYKSFARHCYALHKKKKCKWCNALLSNEEEMLKHRIEMHGSSCAACGLKFKGINTMLKHLRVEHPDFKVDFSQCITENSLKSNQFSVFQSNTCEICGKSFISKYSLNVHYETHNSNKPFLCDSCGKNFKSRRKLKHHKCNNDDEDQERIVNECHICGKRYTFRSSLKRHLLRHTGNKNFQCHVCCKRFYGATNLKNHMVVHERSTVYECQMCCARSLE